MKTLGANAVHLEALWKFTALDDMISLWFQNYHSGISVQNGWEQRETGEGGTELVQLQCERRKPWSWGTELSRWAEAWTGWWGEGRG